MKPKLAHLVSLIVATVFIVAGVLKALDPASFADAIRNYRLVPWTADVALALYLPCLEIVAGISLFWRKTRKGGLLLLAALLAGFLAALVSASVRGLNIACGCFGSGAKSGNLAQEIGLDVVLLVAVAWLIIRETKGENSDCQLPKSG
jgi:uncharacterized membrane protein